MQQAERIQEWYSVRVYRWLINAYVTCSYLLSYQTPQILFTGESIIALFILGFQYLKYYKSFFSLEIVLTGIFGCVGQIFSNSWGLWTYYNKKQPSFLLIFSFVFSCFFLIITSIYSIGILYKNRDFYEGNMFILLILFNSVLFYYTLWMLLCVILAVFFVCEALYRLVTGNLTFPYNANILLPFLFYPRMPNQGFMNEANNEVQKYQSKEHSFISECILCLLDFKDGDAIYQLSCHKTHIFHRSCLRLWRIKSNTCPMCRENITELRELS